MVVFTIVGILAVAALVVMGLVFLGLVTYPPLHRAFAHHITHAQQQLQRAQEAQ